MHQAWIEAARNFVCFLGEVGKDSVTGEWFKKWNQHLGFFKSQTDAMDIFPAMHELEIWMRKDYNMLPFTYNDIMSVSMRR